MIVGLGTVVFNREFCAMIKRLLALSILTICLTCEDVYVPETTGTLSGSVYPPESGALVRLYQEEPIDSIQVNDDGTFRIEEVPAGNYWVDITADGYGKWMNKNVAVEAGEVTYLGRIHLWSTPWPIHSFTPTHSEIVPPGRVYIRIQSRETLRTATILPALSLTPEPKNMQIQISQLSPGTRIYITGDLMVGTTYNYTLDSTVRTVFDEPLEFPLSVTFRTEPFRITNVVLPVLGLYNLDLGFNAPLDPDTARAYITISPEILFDFIGPGGRTRRGKSISSSVAYRIQPLPAWRPGVNTAVTLSGDLPELGGVTLGHDTTFTFWTDSLEVIQTRPLNGETFVRSSTTIIVDFNTAIADSTLVGAVTLSPMMGHTISPRKYSSIYVTGLYLRPDSSWTANTTYTVTIDTTLKDWYGGSMGEPYEFSFTTQ